MHQDERDVMVRVLEEASEARGGLAFQGLLDIQSGVLRVSDAIGESILRIPLVAGPTAIEIFTDAATEATHVDRVVTQTQQGSWLDPRARDVAQVE